MASVPGGAPVKIYVGTSKHTKALGLKVDELKDGAFRIASGPGWLALLGADKEYTPIEPWGRERSRKERERVNKEWDSITGDKFLSPFWSLFMHKFPEVGIWEFDERGTLNAVYEFLHSLGVRWYAPGEIGEVLPKLTDIPLPTVNRTFIPDFPVRSFRIYYTHAGLGDVAPWMLRLGTDPGGRHIGHAQPGHGIKFVLGREEFVAANPEVFAHREGKIVSTHKDTGIPCLSSEKLFHEHVKYVRALLDHYNEPMVSIDMPDGFGSSACRCDQCAPQATPDRGPKGALSDYVWNYLNRVAEEIHKSHPGRMLSGLAYSAYQLPPEKIAKMSPNLAVMECRWRSEFHNHELRDSFAEIRRQWLEKLPSKKYAVWDYYLNNRPGSRGLPTFFPKLIAEDLHALKGISLGDVIEVYKHPPSSPKPDYDPFAIEHLNIYVTSRLWWDADLNLEELLEEYYTLYYGPAREEMKAFIEFSQSNWMRMRQDAVAIQRGLDLLNTARQAAPDDSIYARRIAKVVEYVKPIENLKAQLSQGRKDVPSYRVLEVRTATKKRSMKEKALDGNLDPEFWPPVRVGALTAAGDGNSEPSTTFQVFREGEFLYFGIRCQEPEIDTLKTSDPGLEESDKMLEGDYVTLLLATSTHSFYEIAIDPSGTVLDVDHGGSGGKRWSSGAKAAVHRGDGFWSAEIRVPIAGEGASVLDPMSGIDGSAPRAIYPWYFNVVRQRTLGDDVQRLSYSPSGSDDFRDPKHFGKLWGK